MAGDPDDIDRRLRELTEEIDRARIHEPSARERAATKRANKPRRGRRVMRVLSVAIVIILAVAGGGFAWGRSHHVSWLSFSSPKHSTATPRPSITTKVVPPNHLTGPPADPFGGTPANAWADGASGIVVPQAHAHGPYTVAQVAAAYQTTRELLIAGNLNWPTLRGGYPSAFVDLLTKSQRSDFLDSLNKQGLDKQGFPLSTRDWLTAFAPGSTVFATDVVKVHGTMSAAEARNSNGTQVLRITVNYLFTYAVEPPRAPSDWMRVVGHQQGYIDFAQWDDPGGALEPWFDGSSSVAGALCGTSDGYDHPDFPQGPPPTYQPSGAPIDPYSLATSPPSDHYTCNSTTGT